MKKIIFLTLFLLLIIVSSSPTKFFSFPTARYIHINPNLIKKSLDKEELYILDTRKMEIMAEGYIPNTILIPSTNFTWLPSVVPDGAYVVIISDGENYMDTYDKIKDLGKYRLFGYALYEELINSGLFNIQKVIYNENTLNDIKTIVENNEYIIDIREISEYRETGVIKEAHLINFSTFLTNYEKIPKKGDIYVYCKKGLRAVVAMSFAKRAGYKNNFIIMRAGMEKIIEEKYPVIPYNG